jgi:hypothetical protein
MEATNDRDLELSRNTLCLLLNAVQVNSSGEPICFTARQYYTMHSVELPEGASKPIYTKLESYVKLKEIPKYLQNTIDMHNEKHPICNMDLVMPFDETYSEDYVVDWRFGEGAKEMTIPMYRITDCIRRQMAFVCSDTCNCLPFKRYTDTNILMKDLCDWAIRFNTANTGVASVKVNDNGIHFKFTARKRDTKRIRVCDV